MMCLACGEWARRTGQIFATGQGKSAHLTDTDDACDPGFTVCGQTILPAREFEYLGVTLTTAGPTDASLLRRADAASRTLERLKHLRILVRGMRPRHARYVYDTFIVSKWQYASFIQPLTDTARTRLDSLDAGFLSATLVACRTTGTGKRRSTLPIMRALARLPTPAHRRQAQAHQYTRRLLRIMEDDSAANHTRERARKAHAALADTQAFRDLVPDVHNPWTAQDERDHIARQWNRAARGSRRPVPPPGPRHLFLPPALRLREQWAVALAVRYHCASFPILHRPLPREGPPTRRGTRPRPVYEQAVRTQAETEALSTLKLLHETEASHADLRAITHALRVLRPREKWARRPAPTA